MLDKYISSYERPDYYRWAVIEKESKICIGQIAIFLVDNKNHFCEIEYALGSKFHRKGYATEAVKAILNFSFTKVHFHKVQVCHKAENLASQGVIRKCNFTYEGTLRDFFFMDGKYVNRLYYSMLREEYEKLEKKENLFIEVRRTNSDNECFRRLVSKLEEYLARTDDKAHAECKQHNKLCTIKHVIVAYIDGEAAGCGAIRKFDENTIEIKRMFVSHNAQNKGIGASILASLEAWAKELGFEKSVLETGVMMPEAIKFYEKNNYSRIPNYGQYEGMEKSICFSKLL